MTEMIESNTTLEVTDDAGENQLLIGLKCTVVVVQPGYPILNKPHSMRRVFCQNKAWNYQHNTEETTKHYPQ